MSDSAKPQAYIPEGAKINVTNELMTPPTTLYERTRSTFDRDIVNDIVKGQYGITDKDRKSTGL